MAANLEQEPCSLYTFIQWKVITAMFQLTCVVRIYEVHSFRVD